MLLKKSLGKKNGSVLEEAMMITLALIRCNRIKNSKNLPSFESCYFCLFLHLSTVDSYHTLWLNTTTDSLSSSTLKPGLVTSQEWTCCKLQAPYTTQGDTTQLSLKLGN